jgi:hypothetical protein
MSIRTEPGHRWASALLVSALGFLIVLAVWPATEGETARFFVGVLLGMSIAAVIAVGVGYRTERRKRG